jgi:hypothetical protein
MQIIFTATTGRSGTHNLYNLFQRFARNCVAEHGAPDLIRMDVEGHEVEIFEGMLEDVDLERFKFA